MKVSYLKKKKKKILNFSITVWTFTNYIEFHWILNKISITMNIHFEVT